MKTVNSIKMKTKTLAMLFSVCLLSFTQIVAQSPTLPLTTEDIGNNIPDNAYLKDLNDDLDKFVGTWEYFNNGEKLTIIIRKTEMFGNEHSRYFEDILEAKYRYEINGVVIIDNLQGSEMYIAGSSLVSNNLNQIYLELVDPERKRVNYELKLEHQIELSMTSANAVEKLLWKLKITEIGWCGRLPNQPAPSVDDCRKDNRLPLAISLMKL